TTLFRSGRAEQALAAKSALLQEVDHRVKNNLQLISSLMLLQSRRAGSEAATAALRRMLERVSAVAAVHRRLFQGERFDRFELGPFVGELVEDLSRNQRGLRIDAELEPVEIPASHAAPMALIVSELVTNALRHAYPGGEGEVRVALRRLDDGMELTVADSGVGAGAAPAGFGLTIAELLCRQVRGRLELESGHPGLRARLVFGQAE
ncbi:MAG: sensor histidine kinase, partial [Phenylobacterium sp.]